MARIFLFSGASGCGKTTFANTYAIRLLEQAKRPVYVIHGDDFHRGFRAPGYGRDFFANGQASDEALWGKMKRFIRDCVVTTADRALQDDMDVIIDCIIEDGLSGIQELAKRHQAGLYYTVLMADEREIVRRVLKRGDPDLVERAVYLKRKLEVMPENQGHFYDITRKNPEEAVRDFDPESFRCRL